MSEPRKASDILLELEKKLDIALSIIRTQDLNIKILSNKLNAISETLDKRANDAPKAMVEAVHQAPRNLPPQVGGGDNNVFISAEYKLPSEAEPNGFRRTSRPETFAGDDAYLEKTPPPTQAKYPVQIPGGQTPPPGRGPAAEVVVPPPPPPKKPVEAASPAPEPPKPAQATLQNAIPVQQRVVNAHGKSLFLADVEIIDLATMQQIYKTRTNGTGKWMASVGVGDYRIIVRKMDPATKQKLEVTQDINIDGSQSPLELQTVIIKG